MRRQSTTLHAALPLALTAAVLLACSATMEALTGQATGSGSTASTSSAGHSSSKSIIINTPNFPAARSSSSAAFRLPTSSATPQSALTSSIASNTASAGPAPGINTSSVPQVSLSDDEAAFREMLLRVLQAKTDLQVEREGPTFTLNDTPTTGLVIAEEPEPAGCFTDDGIWTVDDTSCADDQSQAFVQLRTRPEFEREPIAMGMPAAVIRVAMVSLAVPVEPAEETRMNAVTQSWYPRGQGGDDTHDQTIAVLRSKAFAATLQLVIERMQGLWNDVRQVPSIAQRIQASIQWAQQLLGALQAPSTPTLASIDGYKDDVREQIGNVQAALQELPGVPPNFTTMQQRIGRIVDRAPLVFARMGTADIPLPNEAAEAYLEAKDAYEALLNCDPADACPELLLAVDALSRMAREIDYAIGDSGEFWMYDEVDLILNAQ